MSVQEDGVRVVVVEGEGAEAIDMLGAEGGRLADAVGAGIGVGDLEADGEVAGEQAEAEGDAVGVQPVDDGGRGPCR